MVPGSKSEPEVKFTVLRILVEGRPPIELPIPKAGDGKKPSAHFVLRERCKYRLQFEFMVRNELLLGLQYSNKVWRLKRQGQCLSTPSGMARVAAEVDEWSLVVLTCPYYSLFVLISPY